MWWVKWAVTHSFDETLIWEMLKNNLWMANEERTQGEVDRDGDKVGEIFIIERN